MFRYTSNLVLFALGLLFLHNSCTKEIITEFPFANLSRENGLLFSDTSLCVGQAFSVRLRVGAGSSKLTKLAIYENESLLSTARIKVEGGSSFTGENPILLTGSEQTSLTYNITIDPDVDTSILKYYFFRVVDELNQPAVASVGIDIGFPNITFVEAPSVVSSDSTIFIGEKLHVRLDLADCWQDLSTLEILEDNVLIPSNQIEIKLASDSSNVAAGNPLSIRDADRASVIYDVFISPTLPLADSTKRAYVFNLRNSNDQLGTDTIDVLNVEPTPLEFSSPQTYVLINQAAGEGNGGLDLDTGQSTDADSEEAELQDEGIITTNNVTTNWRSQISVVNPDDTEMRVVNGDLTIYDFTFREQIINAFNNGGSLDGNDTFSDDENGNKTTSDEQGEEAVSQALKIGDVFVLVRQGKYYVIQCQDVITEIGNNQDRYELLVLF